MSSPRFVVDRLWPNPMADLDIDDAFADLTLPDAPRGRPLVGVNMVTSVDGRAQLRGTAEGLGSRADRRLMRLLRVPYDAVGSGVGTLRASGVWLRVPDDLAARRRARGLPSQPTGVVVAGRGDVPLDAGWFEGDEPRLLVTGAGWRAPVPDGTELVVAPTERPEPSWLLAELSRRGIGSVLFEGGPTLNAALLAVDAIDELYWSVGAKLVGTDALPLVAPIPGGSPWADAPREGRLVSVHRHDDELYLRYRFLPDGDGASIGP